MPSDGQIIHALRCSASPNPPADTTCKTLGCPYFLGAEDDLGCGCDVDKICLDAAEKLQVLSTDEEAKK